MMIPRWLIPALSVVAALAVAVAAVLIGIRFAAPSVTETAAGTVLAPVVAPVSLGGPPASGENPDGTLLVSDAVGERAVVPPGGQVDDSATYNLIDTVAGAPDPTVGVIALSGDEPAPTPGDPCSPASGEPAADCPSGLHSTIRPLIAPRRFVVFPQAFPPTQAEYAANGNLAPLWCDGLTVTDGDVPLGIFSTAPASFTIRYWPSADPGNVTTLDPPVETLGADADAYEVAFASAHDITDVPVLRRCLVLPGLEPGTAYTAVVSATTLNGDHRVADPYTLRFNSSGAPVHPGAQIVTLGENLILVSALHPADQAVTIRVATLSNGQDSTCDGYGYWDAFSLHPLTTAETTIDADTVNMLNVPPTFTGKTVLSFAVPEGTNVIVCARWYSSSGVPSWDRVQPLFESGAVLSAPDRALPYVELYQVDANTSIDYVDFTVSTPEGAPCGSFRWTPDLTNPLNRVVCTLSSTGGALADGDLLRDVRLSGDLTMTAVSHFITGESTTALWALSAADDGCRGDCPLPASQWYRLDLAPLTAGTGLCGSSFGGDCTPPTRNIVSGIFDGFIEWSHGNSNGQTDWNITRTVDRAPDYVQPDRPQINTDTAVWSFEHPTATSNSVRGSLTIQTDRPVHYILFLKQGGVTATGCDGRPLTAQGATNADSATIFLAGLCLGQQYETQLELFDDSGHASTWGRSDPATFWFDALFEVPRLHVTMTYRLRAAAVPDSYLHTLDITVNSTDAGAVDGRSGRCLSDGLIQSDGSFVTDLGDTETVTLTLYAPQSTSWTPDDCNHYSGDRLPFSTTIHIPLDAFMRLEGAVVNFPNPYGAVLTLWATVTP